MSDSQHTHMHDEETSAWRPGAKLKSLREEAKISLDKIATETRIPFGKLQALEEDAYATVGTEVYTTAYIRKYAKYLGISSDPFVDQYKLVTGSKAHAAYYGDNAGAVADNVESGAGFSLVNKFRAWQVVVVVVVVWLLSVVLLDADKPEEDLALPESSTEQKRDIPGPTVESKTVESAPYAQEAVGKAEAEPEQLPDPVSEDITEEAGVTKEVPANAANSLQVATGADTLEMSFLDECWVKVWDAKGEVIFAHLQNSGDNLRLSGEAPFSVMLGNAHVVDLVINGRRVSTEPPAGKRTLRLNVGP